MLTLDTTKLICEEILLFGGTFIALVAFMTIASVIAYAILASIIRDIVDS